MIKKVLIIAENFPPLGGAGVQRTLKFVKYLPLFGWQPIIVTGDGVSRSNWSPTDKSMQKEISNGLSVYRSNESSDIENTTDRAVCEHKPNLIFVSMSPFSHSRIAKRIAEKYGIPWVADLRDPWALDEFQTWRTAWHYKKALREMFNSIRSASLIIMNTPQAELNLRSAFPQIDSKKITNITNGYDANDFRMIENRANLVSNLRTTQKFTIVHSGFLHSKAGIRQHSRRWWYKLFGGSTQGVRLLSRSHYYLVQALEKWQRQEPEISRSVKIILAGSLTDIDKKIINDSSVSSMFESTGYINHERSVDLVCNANLLFLPMHKLARGQRSSIVPGKTYEYMASGNPILAAVPEGDARDFLKKSGIAKICDPENVDDMLDILKTVYSNWSAGGECTVANISFIEQFERRVLTEKLSKHFDRLTNN